MMVKAIGRTVRGTNIDCLVIAPGVTCTVLYLNVLALDGKETQGMSRHAALDHIKAETRGMMVTGPSNPETKFLALSHKLEHPMIDLSIARDQVLAPSLQVIEIQYRATNTGLRDKPPRAHP
jgi:hypothetical protein